jgi:hypothetical protein
MMQDVKPSIHDWLDARTPGAPETLDARIREMIGADATFASLDVTEACLAAAERHLALLLAGDQRSRSCATDLLAVDALVTYAFEAAADEPSRLAERAEHAMRVLSARCA